MPEDTRKKLDALVKTLGLKTGNEIAAPAEKPRECASAEDAPPPHAVSSNPQLSDLRARLERLAGRQTRGPGQCAPDEAEAPHWQPFDFEIERVLPGEIIGDAAAGFFLAQRDYPLEYQQGALALGDVLEVPAGHIATAARDPELADFDPRTTLFMDTETIGLAGGAGTVAFLVGVGRFEGDVFRLEQCFMRDYDDEEPMLEYLAQRFAGAASVAGYNSKSFDLPLLRTRFVQHRIPFPLEGARHFDLVHAARRFWKRRLADCSLGNIEREVLGVRRQGDVPGHLIPQRWFDYLQTRDARPLERVFYHHRNDILSLAVLTAWMARSLEAGPGAGAEHAEDLLSIVRLHFQQKAYDEVIAHAAAFLESEDRPPLRRECLEMLAMAYKRRNRFDEMQRTWEALLEACPGDLTARHELIKHHEHRTRNLAEAERLCNATIAGLERYAAGPDAPELASWRKRLERIQGKLRKGRGATDDFDAFP